MKREKSQNQFENNVIVKVLKQKNRYPRNLCPYNKELWTITSIHTNEYSGLTQKKTNRIVETS